jgi:twitching motility protein PilT
MSGKNIGGPQMDILRLVANAKSRNASDIHLSGNCPPMMRIDGVLEVTNDNIPLTEAEVQQAFYELSSPDKLDVFYRNLELDFSYTQPDGTRLRCSVAQQRGKISLTIRILTPKLPTIDELELPEIYKKFALMQKGLIVVSGPTGSGDGYYISIYTRQAKDGDIQVSFIQSYRFQKGEKSASIAENFLETSA